MGHGLLALTGAFGLGGRKLGLEIRVRSLLFDPGNVPWPWTETGAVQESNRRVDVAERQRQRLGVLGQSSCQRRAAAKQRHRGTGGCHPKELTS